MFKSKLGPKCIKPLKLTVMGKYKAVLPFDGCQHPYMAFTERLKRHATLAGIEPEFLDITPHHVHNWFPISRISHSFHKDKDTTRVTDPTILLG